MQSTIQAVTRAAEIMGEYVQASAARALVGLCSPSWGDHVILTAAAMVAEAAMAAATKTVLAQLPGQLQQILARQLDVATAHAMRVRGGSPTKEGLDKER